jgi:hypothetical protein
MKHRHRIDIRFDRMSPSQKNSGPESPEMSRKREPGRTKRIRVRSVRKGRR